MNIAELITDLDKIKRIAQEWDKSSNISTIERDIVLDKLRNIYENIISAEFNAPSVSATPAKGEAAAQVVTQEQITTREVVAELNHVHVQESKPIQGVEPIQGAEHVQEPEPIQKPEPQSESQPQPQSEPQSEPTPVKETLEVIDLSLFNEESAPAKPKLDRRVILSLYGDDVIEEQPKSESAAKTEAPTEPQPQVQVQTQTQTQVQPQVQPYNETPRITTVDKPRTAVLGDVIGNGSHTVGDMMSNMSDKIDVATKVVTDKSSSLRKMIGINDKFLMIRDLFAGNASAYEQTISTLESFNDLDDALIHIHENYSWNPNNEGVKLLVELLTRKLS